MRVETLTCQACQTQWERTAIGGRKPRWCAGCAPGEHRRLQREAAARHRNKDPEARRAAERRYYRENRERMYQATRAWAQRNPEKMRRIRVEYAYGRPLEEIDALRATAVCAICGTTDADTVWHIDHDHSCCTTGRKGCGRCVRGLLCADCNTLLGRVEKNPSRFLRVLDYATINPRVDWSRLKAEVGENLVPNGED